MLVFGDPNYFLMLVVQINHIKYITYTLSVMGT